MADRSVGFCAKGMSASVEVRLLGKLELGVLWLRDFVLWIKSEFLAWNYERLHSETMIGFL